jgi:hypothetical protein
MNRVMPAARAFLGMRFAPLLPTPPSQGRFQSPRNLL